MNTDNQEPTPQNPQNKPQTETVPWSFSTLPRHQLVAGLIALVVLAAILTAIFATTRDQPIDEYTAELAAEINQGLSDENHEIRKRIESAHVTVTTTGASVSAIEVKTLDDSRRIKKDASNISEVDVTVTVYWDGVIHKNGYTKFRFIVDAQAGEVTQAGLVESSAMFNAEEVDWYKVGTGIAAFLLL